MAPAPTTPWEVPHGDDQPRSHPAFPRSDLYDRDGDKIGTIDEIYLDKETNEPEWALVNTGLFGTKQHLRAAARGDRRDGDLSVPFDKAQVKDAPSIDADGELSQPEEAELYRHYGLDYSEPRSDTGLAEGGAGTRPTATGPAARDRRARRLGPDDR